MERASYITVGGWGKSSFPLRKRGGGGGALDMLKGCWGRGMRSFRVVFTWCLHILLQEGKKCKKMVMSHVSVARKICPLSFIRNTPVCCLVGAGGRSAILNPFTSENQLKIKQQHISSPMLPVKFKK